MRIIVEDGSDPVVPDTSLVRLLVRAHVIRERLINDRSLTSKEIAKSGHEIKRWHTRGGDVAIYEIDRRPYLASKGRS